MISVNTAAHSHHTASHLNVVARGQNGQPRTYRLAPSASQKAAYRRLALTILGLDVATLARQLHSVNTTVAQSA
jgi:hypothetical protein